MEIWRAVDTLKIIMETEAWREFQSQKMGAVT